MKSINAIGVDIGYGYTKVCGERLSRVFPSQVTKLRPRGAFGSQPEIMKLTAWAIFPSATNFWGRRSILR